MDETGRPEGDELTLEPATVVRSRRPRALWGVLAAVAVATGALVVTSASDDGSPRPGLPVAFGSAIGGGGEAAASADAMRAWITYVAGDDLPALGDDAPAYRLVGAVDEAQVRALADALGVAGDIVHEGPTWRVGDDEGSLEVYESGGAQWWYSVGGRGIEVDGSGSSTGVAGGEACDAADPADCGVTECPPNARCDYECPDHPTTTASARCVGPVPPDDVECTEQDGCMEPVPLPVEPTPPADLPSEGEARAIALDLLAATGLDTDDAVVTVDGPYDAWYVTVEPRVDGVPSGLIANVSVGSEGKVTNASGYLSTPERLGDYPVLDTRAAIARANAQLTDGIGYGRDVGVATASGTDTGGTTGGAPDVGTAPANAADDPCAPPEGASDGCGGTTGGDECEACDPIDDQPVSTVIDCAPDGSGCGTAGGTDGPDTTVVPGCKVQPDGSEICEVEPGITCPQVAAPADEPVAAPECTPPLPDPTDPPVPLPEPEPLEVVLVDAEPALMLLAAVDGSTDAYLVPAYRFTDADGGRVDLPAVADESLATPPTTDTTVPDTVEPDPVPVPEPQPCEVLEEQDASGTTHTVQPDPACGDEDLALELGVPYYVDVDNQCWNGTFALGGQVWRVDDEWVAEWGASMEPGERYEGGMFTLDAPDHGSFVGDAAGTKVAEFRTLGPAEDIFCMPEPRG